MIITKYCAVATGALALSAFQIAMPHRALADSCVLVSQAKYGVARNGALSSLFSTGPGSTVRVIIGFRKRIDDLNIAMLVPGKIIHRLKIVNAIAVEVPVTALDGLARNPDIRTLEVDGRVQAFGTGLYSDIREGEPDPTSSQVVPPGIRRTGAPEVWTRTTGQNVKVAVIDTGIDSNHPDLLGRIIGGQNFSSNDREAWTDGNGHGTHVSGIVAANNNNIGVVGMAPEASLIAVKVLDDLGTGRFSDVVAGIEYAINAKADVANLSLGGTMDSQAMHEAVIRAHKSGLIVAAAAGNNGEVGENPLSYPGAYPEVVGTAAVDDNDLRAYFSSYNKYVALAAPGVNVLSLDKNLRYIRHSGTSMAAPHVAGALALIKAAFPDESTSDLKRRLVCSADELFPPGRNIWTGHGVVNVRRALAQSAPASCDYLHGEISDPVISEPEQKPTPASDSKTIYVKTMSLKLINDGSAKRILVNATLTGPDGRPQAGLSVTSQIMERVTGPLGTATAVTDRNGAVQFVLRGFTCGHFIAAVTKVSDQEFSPDYGQPSAAIDLGAAYE